MDLDCVFCLLDFSKDAADEPRPAVTIAEGNATCDEHLGEATNTKNFVTILRKISGRNDLSPADDAR